MRLVTDDDRVFKALADPTRRFLLDRLFTRDGRTLTELESELEMTRFGVMKHLRVLEDAGLVKSQLELSQDGKALNYFEVAPFDIALTPSSIAEAAQSLSAPPSKSDP